MLVKRGKSWMGPTCSSLKAAHDQWRRTRLPDAFFVAEARTERQIVVKVAQ